MYQLRDYQQTAVDLAIQWLRKNSDPVLLELATGAGKSLICAEIARVMRTLSDKKVLCLCPTAELVEQNAEKFSLTGEGFSIYSASIGKSLREDVVFATEGTFKSVSEEHGGRFSCVIIDEAHKITPTIKKIIEDMRKSNPLLRVVGMSGTPYRLGTGYIYEIDENGQKMDDAKDPYFKKLIYKVGAGFLVDLGYLTRPAIGNNGVKGYDTKNLKLNSSFNFVAKDLDEAFVGKGNKTAEIVADVIRQCNERGLKGVMFFAATVKHADEIMASLPAYNSALITGETKKKERKDIIKRYKSQEIKYLVNVAVLTTGFDAPHTDCIAILRATESASLLTQIIGRGLRLSDGKEYCLILDYAENLEKFFPDGDIFNPKIESFGQKPQKKESFICPECGGKNDFTLRLLDKGKKWDEFGYQLELNGKRSLIQIALKNPDRTEFMPVPAHHGRRCQIVNALGKNNFSRCSYYWTCKECVNCGHKNDIAARVCESCDCQLIDPNNKLSVDFIKFKADLTQVQTDRVKGFIKKQVKPGVYLGIFETEYRKFEVFFSDRVNSKFLSIIKSPSFKPITVSYKKQSDSKYFIISDFNRQEDRDNDFS